MLKDYPYLLSMPSHTLICSGVLHSSLLQHLCKQQVELVLTAHPTQALRASLLKKYAHVRKELDNLHNKRMSPYEKVWSCLSSGFFCSFPCICNWSNQAKLCHC